MNEQEKYYKTKNLNNKIKGFGCLAGIVIIVILIATSSGNSKPAKVNEPSSSIATSNPSQEEPKTETFKIGDSVMLDDNTITVKEAKDCTPKNSFLKPESGMKFISVDVLQENNGEGVVSHNPLYFSLQDNKDFSYQVSFKGCQDPAFATGELQKGQKTRGFLTFEIPKENSASQLIFKPSLFSTDQVIIQLHP